MEKKEYKSDKLTIEEIRKRLKSLVKIYNLRSASITIFGDGSGNVYLHHRDIKDDKTIHFYNDGDKYYCSINKALSSDINEVVISPSNLKKLIEGKYSRS